MTAPEVNAILQYVMAQGTLTPEGMKLLQQIIAIIKDHEARITALEP